MIEQQYDATDALDFVDELTIWEPEQKIVQFVMNPKKSFIDVDIKTRKTGLFCVGNACRS